MAERTFIVGETVLMRLRVSKAGTRTPENPSSVMLSSLVRSGVAIGLPVVTSFTRTADGAYELPLDSAVMSPGTYTWRARVAEGASKVAVGEDTFVLRA